MRGNDPVDDLQYRREQFGVHCEEAAQVVQIAESGVFSGTVSIDVAEIRGKFEGELTARKQLVIYATGRVSGTIRYGKIRIEEGGEISGEISTLGAAAPASVAAVLPAASVTAATAMPAPPAAPASAPAINATRPTLPAAAAAAAKEPLPSTLHIPQPAPRGGKPPGKGSTGTNTL